jgi:HEPN domain-containing protein
MNSRLGVGSGTLCETFSVHNYGEYAMKKLLILAALAIPMLSTAAAAQPYGYGNRNGEVRRELRECNRELRNADSRRAYQRELRECRRELAQARHHSRYDNRYDRHNRYDRYDRRNDDRGYHGRHW